MAKRKKNAVHNFEVGHTETWGTHEPVGNTLEVASVDQAAGIVTLKQVAPEFTGVAYTMQASNSSGIFPNFRICTLFIVKGVIEYIEKTQEFAGFEAIAKTEVLMERSLWNLSSRYADGQYMRMGGESRDQFVNRIKISDPGLLKRIAPAIGIEVKE